MSLTAADIAEIARLLDESKFSSLTLETGGMKLRIRRDGGGWSAPAEEAVEEVAPSPAADEPPPALGQEAGAARAGEIDVPPRCSATSTPPRGPATRRSSSPAMR